MFSLFKKDHNLVSTIFDLVLYDIVKYVYTMSYYEIQSVNTYEIIVLSFYSKRKSTISHAAFVCRTVGKTRSGASHSVKGD